MYATFFGLCTAAFSNWSFEQPGPKWYANSKRLPRLTVGRLPVSVWLSLSSPSYLVVHPGLENEPRHSKFIMLNF